jgi:hypothetical protein
MLKTIKAPRNMNELNKVLPAPNYTSPSIIESSPEDEYHDFPHSRNIRAIEISLEANGESRRFNQLPILKLSQKQINFAPNQCSVPSPEDSRNMGQIGMIKSQS